MGAAALPPLAHTGRVDLAAWLGVAAGSIGLFMAMLDILIINSSLRTIQGQIGSISSEGNWIATAYLVAEIVVIPLTGWLRRLFGLRRFLVIAAVLFTACSVICGQSDNFAVMICRHVDQGFTGGAMIPTGLTIIATRLPLRNKRSEPPCSARR